MKKKIVIVLGTAKEGNHSSKIFSIAKDYLLTKDEYEIIPVNVADFLFSKTVTVHQNAEIIKPWADIIEQSDAIIFVSPEYNHSYPGELKILIDSLFEEYKGKVAGIISTSMGPYAGVRLVEELKTLLHTVNFDVSLRAVNVPNVQEEFSNERIEKIHKHIEGMINDIEKRF
jgi:NAD(P)H-dependent FMN reductase